MVGINFEDWEQRKLGDLAEIVRGASPRPIQNPKWFDSNSDIGWLRISDVTKQNGRIYTLEQKISKAGEEKTRVLTEAHLLLSIAATVGKPVINYVKTGVHDGFLIFINPIFNKEFMFQWLEMYKPKWKKYGQPGSQVNLNSELVKNQEILLPTIEEQSKISELFVQIDKTIALHQGKLEKLKQLKKGYMQRMFPEKTEKMPSLRFANFSQDWEQRKLGSSVKVIRSYSLSRDVETNEKTGFRYIHYGDIHKKVANLIVSDKVLPKIKVGDYDLLQKGDVVVADASEDYIGIAEPSLLLEEPTDKVVAGLHTIALRPHNMNSLYLYYLLHTNNFKKFGGKVGTGMKVFGITSTNLLKYEYQVPDKLEQKQIGIFLKKLDDTITLNHDKVEKLKYIKEVYLHKLFI